MSTIRKFLFEMDFGGTTSRQPEPQEIVVEEPIEEIDEPLAPLFSEEELNLARERAFDEGQQQGIQECLNSAASQTANVLSALSRQMSELAVLQAEANDEIERNAVRVVLSALKKIFPAASEANAFEEIARMVGEVIGHVLDEPRIIVRVSESLVEPLRGRLEEVAAGHGFEGRVVVQADARLSPGDCRVEWADGGAERDQARLLAEVEATVERALAPPERHLEQEEAVDVPL